MRPDPLAGLFDPFGGDFFGSGSIAPESVARKVLGIGGTVPLDKAGIKAAFRFRVRLLRPDLSDAQADELRAKDVAGEDEWRPAHELSFESGSKQEQLAELLWARADLLRRVPEPVTAGIDGTRSGFGSRNGKAPPRPVTDREALAAGTLSSRNARLLALVEPEFERRKGWLVGTGRWKGKSEAELFTALAKDARLVCDDCAEPIEGPVYLRRSRRYDDRTHLGNGVRARCGRCHADRTRKAQESKWPRLRVSGARRCSCGTELYCTGDSYYSNGWWYARTAESCSPLCAREQANAEARERRRARRAERVCAVCEETFEPARSDSRYCSSACRQDAYRKRKQGAETA